MWFKVRARDGRPLYIAICYFPPSTSHFASPKGQSPYTILDEDIWEFSRDGDVILLGDFNARTACHQSSFFDTSEEILRELDLDELGMTRRSQDAEECTEYGRYLLEMGTAHGLAILNGLDRYPHGGGFTCFPHRHGASTVDYVLAPIALVSRIQELSVSSRPIGVVVDHAYISCRVDFHYTAGRPQKTAHRRPRYTFCRETDGVYT